jgi:hypothetical protein
MVESTCKAATEEIVSILRDLQNSHALTEADFELCLLCVSVPDCHEGLVELGCDELLTGLIVGETRENVSVIAVLVRDGSGLGVKHEDLLVLGSTDESHLLRRQYHPSTFYYNRRRTKKDNQKHEEKHAGY